VLGRAWQSFCTTSFHVLFGLPLGLEPFTSYSIHFFTRSFHSTCAYHHNLFCCSINIKKPKLKPEPTVNFKNFSHVCVHIMSYTVHNWQSPLLRYYLLDRRAGGVQPPPLIKSKNNFNLLGTSPVDWEVQEVNRHLCSQTPQQCTEFIVTHEHKTVFQQINIVSSFPSPWHNRQNGLQVYGMWMDYSVSKSHTHTIFNDFKNFSWF